MWFIENPWPPVLICVAVAVVLLLMFINARRKPYLIGIAACVSIAVLSFVVDMLVLTNAEAVEIRVVEMVREFEAKDLPGTFSYFSPMLLDGESQVRKKIEFHSERVTFDTPLRITDVEVIMKAQDSVAESTFRVNGTITVDGASVTRPTKWLVEWNKSDRGWLIRRVIGLDPITGLPVPWLPSFE